MKIWLALLALAAPAAAFAAENVTLSSEVFVERVKPGADGKPAVVREAPKIVTPGDKLVFELSYRNQGAQPATGFALTDPIPDSVAFAGSASPGATFSVDGGRTWGPLASLKVVKADGTSRPALPSDVTHVRWAFGQAIPAGASGKVSFRGVVK
ncbi:MAG: DUF11 domain-containing protein [Alphaproteobacteria bacterium]|nr:DUF11 domain-containing protein [Alphaproteobacteria bacterium]MBV9373231.1 DUF11 domain-containing protein [Alphaproteobacteria bacterium]MBV9900619.1 DUF11 domain-containing protein [Alphaproteobacteria bacterium]